MESFNTHYTKTHLSSLLKKVEAGESFVIAKDGKPVAMLNPYVKTETPQPRVGGQWKGLIWMADDFDAADAEIEALFANSRIFPDEADTP